MKKVFKILLTCLVSLWPLASGAQEKHPLVIGETVTLSSKILQEKRTINIYLPPQYHAEHDTTSYPVVYILDGGMEGDFLHLTGLLRYDAQPWVKRAKPSIVVGIANVNRQKDFTFPVENLDFLKDIGYSKKDVPVYGGSANFILFLQQELQPFIRAHYRTNGRRTIIGESLAGLLATEILLKRPQLFNTYLIISPSLWWGSGSLLHQADSLLGANLKTPVNVFLAAPGEKRNERMFLDANKLYGIIKENHLIHSYFDYLPHESHATVLHQAVYNAYKYFLSP